MPAPECLAVDELAECARAAIENDGTTVLSYGPGGGYAPLRAWIAERHGVEPARVVVTSGSLQGFDFLVEQLVRPGSRVLVEAPTYDRPLKILARLGAEVVPLEMDEEGLVPEALEAALADGRQAGIPLHDRHLSESERPYALGGASPTRRRDRARHDLRRARGRSVRLVRYEGDAPPKRVEL